MGHGDESLKQLQWERWGAHGPGSQEWGQAPGPSLQGAAGAVLGSWPRRGSQCPCPALGVVVKGQMGGKMGFLLWLPWSWGNWPGGPSTPSLTAPPPSRSPTAMCMNKPHVLVLSRGLLRHRSACSRAIFVSVRDIFPLGLWLI